MGSSATIISGSKNKDGSINPETVNDLNEDGSITDARSGVTFWGGASTTNASGSTITSKKDELDLGGADYVNFNVSVGNLIAWNYSQSLDKYGNIYVSPFGISFAKGITGVSASVTFNNLVSTPNPTETQLGNFLSGHGVSGSAGVLNGVTGGWSLGNGTSTGTGFFSPQIGVSYNYTPNWLIFSPRAN